MFDYSMVRRLKVTRENIALSFIKVIDYMFVNGQYSWDRLWPMNALQLCR